MSGPDADGKVARQRPRRGGPDEQIKRARAVHRRRPARGKAQAHGDGGVLDFLIIAARLEIRQRRGQLPAVGHDAVRAVDAALVPELPEHPPDRLHERDVHGLVFALKIHPPPHAGDGGAPFLRIAQHERAAGLVEDVDALLRDRCRAGEAEFLLRQRLDGQAVAIPAEAAFDVIAAHRPVARHDVLDRPRQQVAVVRQARREGRPVIKHVFRRPLAAAQRFLKRVDLLPIPEHVLLQRGKIHLVRYTIQHAHVPGLKGR
jgi:hypothetical protein